MGIWFKLFPVVFLIAALVDRLRRKDYRAVALGVGIVSVLSLLINVPMALFNFDSWYFYLWMHQNRPTELSLWYWLAGGMDPKIVARPDVTSAINVMSFFAVAAGGLVIATLAWKSPRRNILMPLGCTLLVWWLTFNKVYDPNFDLWLLFVLAVLAAPFWLTATITMVSLLWWIMTFVGLHIAIQPSLAAVSDSADWPRPLHYPAYQAGFAWYHDYVDGPRPPHS